MLEFYYAEDDKTIALAVREYLGEKGFLVRTFPGTKSMQEALLDHLPALVLLDWQLPDGSGNSLCQWIRSRWKKLPIIFLTVREDSKDIVTGFQSGADDYVAKPFDLSVLYSRIQAVLRRTGSSAGSCLSCGGIFLDLEKRTASLHSCELDLSPAEYELLLCLLQNKGRTLTRERLLEQVWDAKGSYVNDNTLTVTMKRLRDKLGQPSCLKTVRSVGYRMEDSL